MAKIHQKDVPVSFVSTGPKKGHGVMTREKLSVGHIISIVASIIGLIGTVTAAFIGYYAAQQNYTNGYNKGLVDGKANAESFLYDEGYGKGYEDALMQNDSIDRDSKGILSNADEQKQADELDEGSAWDLLAPERINGGAQYKSTSDESFIMSGVKYSSGIVLNNSLFDQGKDKVYIYLNKEFEQLSFIIGHVDKSYDISVKMTIYCDDEEVLSQTIRSSAQPQPIVLDSLENAGTLAIRIEGGMGGAGYSAEYGMAELYLVKSE